jgi:putative transposase
MTEHELLQNILYIRELVASDVTAFIAIFFAFTAMTHFIGKSLNPHNQRLMNRIDRLHLEMPFAGARMLRDLLHLEGHRVSRSKVSRLMKLMGIEALYRKPRTTRRNSEHKVYTYLLRNVPVTR